MIQISLNGSDFVNMTYNNDIINNYQNNQNNDNNCNFDNNYNYYLL